MILSHYSAQPLAFDPERIYPQNSDVFKPIGFWLSDDGDHGWKTWCGEEDWNVGALAYRADFEILPGANILHLSTAEAIRAFTKTHGLPYPRWPSGSYIDVIDWTRVRQLYDGIIISPYQWDCRLNYDVHWYYSWDCASACIWNLRAIRSVDAVSNGPDCPCETCQMERARDAAEEPRR
jgi:hypothetical protein